MLNIDIGRYSSILKEIERNEASIFLIKKNGQSFDSNLNYLNKSSNSEYNTFYTDYKFYPISEPYSPFCSLIKNFTNTKKDLDYLMNELSVYPAHKELFKSFIFNGKANRIEEILPFDYAYEKSRFFTEFLNFFNYYGKKKTLLITLENINYAPISTINWLKWLFTNSSNNNFKIILTLNDYHYYN